MTEQTRIEIQLRLLSAAAFLLSAAIAISILFWAKMADIDAIKKNAKTTTTRTTK